MRRARPSRSARTLLVAELEGAHLVSTGIGNFGVCTCVDGGFGKGLVWLSADGCRLLIGAARSLGFREGGWHAVAKAITAGALPDLLSEAIEAALALPEAALVGQDALWPPLTEHD